MPVRSRRSGLHKGVAEIYGIKLRGLPAWFMHRTYHVQPGADAEPQVAGDRRLDPRPVLPARDRLARCVAGPAGRMAIGVGDSSRAPQPARPPSRGERARRERRLGSTPCPYSRSPSSGPDRPGVIAALTEVLLAERGNLVDASMTILSGQFAMTLVVDVPVDADAGAGRPRAGGQRLGLLMSVREVRRHRAGTATAPYVVSVHGADRPGIVHRSPARSRRYGGNITDLTTRLAGGFYVLVAEIDVPAAVDVGGAAERDVAAAAAELGVTATVSPRTAMCSEEPPARRFGACRSSAHPRRCCPAGRPRSTRTIRRSSQLAADLVATMRASPGCVGLAAPQLGVAARVFVLDVTGHPRPVPAPVWWCWSIRSSRRRARRSEGREGCMSVPDFTGDVGRPRTITVTRAGAGHRPIADRSARTLRGAGFRPRARPPGRLAVPRPGGGCAAVHPRKRYL